VGTGLVAAVHDAPLDFLVRALDLRELPAGGGRLGHGQKDTTDIVSPFRT